jgi:ElaB/YqjD/DUF883 family membrane-anchored ribosome-binding protein
MDARSDNAGKPKLDPQEAAKKVAEQVQQSISKAAENVQQTVSKARDGVQQTVAQVGVEAQKTAENVQQTVAQVRTDAWRGVGEASRTMRESAYNVKETASTSLLNAAESIRREAVKGGNEEVIRQAHRLARNMEKAAVYLDSHTFEQISGDATETVRENPWKALSIAFIFGLLIGLIMHDGRD